MKRPIEVPPHSRRTLPSAGVYSGHQYTSANSTDIAKRFAAIRAAQEAAAAPVQPAENVKTLPKRNAN